MIELNLLEKKHPILLPSVLGLDLNLLNWGMLGFAAVFYVVSEMYANNYFEDKVKYEEQQFVTIKAQSDKVQKEIKKSANIKDQLEAYNKQVEKLKARSEQVDEILKIRTNPKKVLEIIARSVPEDLWLDQLIINENKEIKIIGGAYSPKSIGQFITVVNDSPFFANSIMPVKQENKQETNNGENDSYELFELKGKIKNFDMRSR